MARGNEHLIRSAWLCAAVVGLASCNSDPTGPLSLDIKPFLTTRALQFLGTDGRFLLGVPAISTQYAVIDSFRAESLAVAVLPGMSRVGGIWKFIEMQHGGPLSPDRLRAARRIEFIESPYEPVPSTYPDWIRRAASSMYLVRFLENGRPAVGVAVSVYATDLTIKDGNVLFPAESGEEFSVFGMRADGYERPIGPEQAVQFAFIATGARVDTVPTLLGPQFIFSEEFARWRITLEHPVTLKSLTGTNYTTRVVYVGLSLEPGVEGTRIPNALFVPLAVQPSEDTVRTSPLRFYKVRSGIPIKFDEVVAVRN